MHRPLFRPACLPVLATALALAAPASATVAPLWYMTTVDPVASTASFSVQFDGPLDLFTIDAYARQADSFQFWVDSAAPDVIRRTYDVLEGLLAPGAQTVISAREIPTLNALETIWVLPLTAPGPRDAGGWGSINSHAAYSLSAGNLLTFSMPWAALRETDGTFYYAFETYAYGGWEGRTWEGVSGKYYEICAVPEPSAPLMLLAGLGAFGVGRKYQLRNKK